MLESLCLFCNQPIPSDKPKTAKFCCRKCKTDSSKSGRYINCKHCDKEFYCQRKANKVYCSEDCRILWKKSNKDKLNKYIFTHKCLVCENNYNSFNGRVGFCSKKCQYIKERSESKKTTKLRSDKLLELSGGKCLYCGYNKCKRALTYHHINPKTKSFALDATGISSHSWEKVLEEREKCLLLCQNCHAILHENERKLKVSNTKQRAAESKSRLIDEFDSKCGKCGFTYDGLQAFTFHHIDKTTKSFQISGNLLKPFEELLNEVKKCELLCFNCHMEVEDSLLES